jgi:CDP-diacylglycerol--glycerol-3-phosphate 3-phosphatidyltransferase
MNLPNMLSLLRILLIPILIACYYLPFSWGRLLASAIFILAALTDLLDGYLARRLKQITPLGAFLDPVADKLIVTSAIVLIISQGKLPYLTLASVVIIGREIAVSALREWMAELGKRTSVAVSVLGKVKTVAQMVSLVILLYCHEGVASFVLLTGYALYYVAAALTVWSMVIYFKAAWPELVASSGEDNT